MRKRTTRLDVCRKPRSVAGPRAGTGLAAPATGKVAGRADSILGDQVADPKPPQAALVKSHGRERRGNVGTMIPGGTIETGETCEGGVKLPGSTWQLRISTRSSAISISCLQYSRFRPYRGQTAAKAVGCQFWRFSALDLGCAWMGWSCRRPRDLHRRAHRAPTTTHQNPSAF